MTLVENLKRQIPTHDKDVTFVNRVRDTFGERRPHIQGGRILDAGCSIGLTTYELANLYNESNVVGIDLYPDRLPKYSQHPRVSFQPGNLYFLEAEFPAEHFEAIFTMNNLALRARNITPEEHIIIAKGFHHTLKEGGYLCISGKTTRAILQKKGEGFISEYFSREFVFEHVNGRMCEAYGLELLVPKV